MEFKSKTFIEEKAEFFCPRCQSFAVRQQGSGDYVHECQDANNVLNQEDILILGAWTDYTGSDTTVRNLITQGTINKLQGTRAAVEGARFEPVDSRGFPRSRYRSRQHIEHIDEESFRKKSMKPDRMPEQYEDSHEGNI